MNDVLAVLQECYRDVLGSLLRHEAGARVMSQYDVNNTYQYIINREETHLAWLGAAIRELGGRVDDSGQEPVLNGLARRQAQGERVEGSAASERTQLKVKDGVQAVIEADAREAQAFVDRWRPRVDALPNARHAKMLGVILGEVLEQRRFFEQALAGRTDLLGRRAQHLEPAQGVVLPSRWIE